MKAPTGKLAFAYRTIAALEVERDTLRAEVERYKAMSDNYCALGMDSQVEIAKLRAEVEALRGERDAAAEIANANADQALRLSAEVQVLRGEHGVKS